GTAPDALEPAQAPAEVIVQPAVEFAGRHAAQGFSLLRAAAPDNAVEVGRLRMWQGSQGAAAGEAFVGPAVARPFGAHVRQDGMLPVMPLYSAGPHAVGLHGKACGDRPGFMPAFHVLPHQVGQGAPLDACDAAVLQSRLEGVDHVVVAYDVAQAGYAQIVAVDDHAAQPACL